MKTAAFPVLLACALATAAHAQVSPAELARARAAFVERNYAEALPIFQRASSAGAAEDTYYLAYMHENGLGVPRDSVKAFPLFKLAAERGDINGMQSVGRYYGRGTAGPSDWVTGARWWRKCTELGDPLCTEWLAQLTLKGNGVRADTAAADSLMHLAAGRGNAQAMAILGFNYSLGIRVRADTATAIQWYWRSAERGNLVAARNAGLVLWSIDPWAAATVLDIAVQAGDSTATDWLKKLAPALVRGATEEHQAAGPLYYTDKVRYFSAMREAMRKGSYLAGSAVVEAYQNGSGVRADEELARRMARICAVQGNDTCQSIVAQYLVAGRGGPRDAEAARRFFEEAALQGNTLAMFNLAQMYDNADGIERNNAVAMYWYREADSRGSPRAHGLLKSRGLIEIDPKIKAYLEMIDREGPDRSSIHAMVYEVAKYCMWGGKRCSQLQKESIQFEKASNKAAYNANMSRLWNVYAAPKGSSDADYAKRSACMQKKTESIERATYGKQDWSFGGSC